MLSIQLCPRWLLQLKLPLKQLMMLIPLLKTPLLLLQLRLQLIHSTRLLSLLQQLLQLLPRPLMIMLIERETKLM